MVKKKEIKKHIKGNKQNLTPYLITFMIIALAIGFLIGWLTSISITSRNVGMAYRMRGMGEGRARPTPAMRCKDSDGINYYTKGIATNGIKTVKDYCIRNDTIREFYCPSTRSSYIAYTDYRCEYGCQDGACIKASYCNDSDGGIKYYTRGSCHSNNVGYTDYCTGSTTSLRADTLREYYCVNNTCGYTDYKCPNGCFNGACIEKTNQTNETCYDSDNGINAYTKGTATKDGVSKTDYCQDNRLLIEYYCYGNEIKDTQRLCTYMCEDGKCIKGNNTNTTT